MPLTLLANESKPLAGFKRCLLLSTGIKVAATSLKKMLVMFITRKTGAVCTYNPVMSVLAGRSLLSFAVVKLDICRRVLGFLVESGRKPTFAKLSMVKVKTEKGFG